MTTRPGVVPAAAVVCAVLMLTQCGGSETGGVAITELAPRGGEVEGWAPVGTVQIFEGQDLFDLIDGGAEIYYEFGFRRALSQDYGDAEQRVIALELFEMEDTAASYGLYSFKTRGTGRPMELGDAGLLEDYYLNLRMGPFVATLTGMSTDAVTVEGIVKIARAVAAKVHVSGEVPRLVTELTAGDPQPEASYYLRGELALANMAPFTVGVQFDMMEGAAARFRDRTEIILRYPDARRAGRQFRAVVAELADRAAVFPLEEPAGDSAVFSDDQGKRIQMAQAGPSIALVVADREVETGNSLEVLVSRVAGSTAADKR